MTKTYCRIDGIIARKANKAVLFRLGPKNQYQMLLWDLDTDIITPGQWLLANLSTPQSEITDDAKYVIISASSFGPGGEKRAKRNRSERMPMWISMSHPPYFTALETWETYFRWRQPITAEENQHTLHPHWDIPDEVVALANQINQSSLSERFIRRGWIQSQPKDEFERGLRLTKNCPWGQISLETINMVVHAKVLDKNSQVKLEIGPRPGNFNFIDIDHPGRLVFADKGCLYAWKDFPEGEPTLIADLNPNKFESIPPPDWALKP